ncbi:MAG: hypothetical protein JNK99_15160 [Candidatus Accumulibacter sp.]|uniref:MT-A70 family methyltransferase n=1 Tax=Accumulibacter sp. TaxID=2053492 RepID=UPI001A37D273|nr:hypothetical protein [Accumulibacter sp.]
MPVPAGALPAQRVSDRRPEAHSEKPDASYELIEAVSPGPRLELFARRKRGDWHTWGNEVPCDVSMGHNVQSTPNPV